VEIEIRVDPNAKDLPLPKYMTSGSAGLDLMAAEEALIQPNSWQEIPCGIYLSIP